MFLSGLKALLYGRESTNWTLLANIMAENSNFCTTFNDSFISLTKQFGKGMKLDSRSPRLTCRKSTCLQYKELLIKDKSLIT